MEKLIKHFLIVVFGSLMITSCEARENDLKFVTDEDIITGAENFDEYIGLIKGKNVGVVANQSSKVNNTHLIDTLLSLDINVKKIFSPEHGFRGDMDAGAEINDGADPVTGIPIISLYGEKKKPSQQDLQGLEIVLFDLQDVGARFYTYISTLTYMMEACAATEIPVIVLDRPNPNGFYIDGPVLDKEFRSFVGLHPVPVVHGLTIGEFSMMINGEEWLEQGISCKLTVIEMKGYDHTMIYKLPVRPSPNLPNQESVYLYPSLCLFEGTIISVGRGTDHPFQVIGHPDYHLGSYFFIPEPRPGASMNPKYKGVGCYGMSLSGYAKNIKHNPVHFNISFLINIHDFFKDSAFFNDYFDLLAGNDQLRLQILSGMNEENIRKTWEEDISKYQKIRDKYLLYPDF